MVEIENKYKIYEKKFDDIFLAAIKEICTYQKEATGGSRQTDLFQYSCNNYCRARNIILQTECYILL